MIAFDLQCSQGHIFEGWFASNESFEDQKLSGLVECPYCSDTMVIRIMPAVSVKKSAQRTDRAPGELDYGRLALEVMEYIRTNFEDVGPRFTSEALKIHYGVAEKRNIRGSATSEEEKVLTQEGVEFFKVPFPKKEDKTSN
ncbi:MAG: DUF1178 family protein [Desulfobacteraceae bacterium]|jgi:hypothetical protein|nr:MAG: DUF1178 family protein [Desulfobacteraceae bacterium]